MEAFEFAPDFDLDETIRDWIKGAIGLGTRGSIYFSAMLEVAQAQGFDVPVIAEGNRASLRWAIALYAYTYGLTMPPMTLFGALTHDARQIRRYVQGHPVEPLVHIPRRGSFAEALLNAAAIPGVEIMAGEMGREMEEVMRVLRSL